MRVLLICIAIFYLIFDISIASETTILNGKVSDKKSGEAITGATVALYKPDSNTPFRGAYSNKFGFYSVQNIPVGKYFLKVSSIGFGQYQKSIEFIDSSSIRLDIELNQKDIKTEEVEVTADRETGSAKTISTVNVKPEFLMKMPSIGGENDVFRALQLLPGISQSTELSSGLYIRGGSPDQNLTLLDGVIVYNPSHLGGFLSTFNGDAIRDVRLIKGAFPAEYGGRISSVIDLNMKEGTKEKISGSGGVSLIASRLLLEGPITEDATFMVSGRRMYLDILTALGGAENTIGYYFYDLNAKTNIKISENDHIFFSGYFGRDVMSPPEEEDDDFSIDWGNKTANLRWMHIVSPSLFTNFSLIYTDYNFISGFKDSRDFFETNSGIEDIMLKANAEYFPDESHILKFGAEATYHRFLSEVNSSENINDFIEIKETRINSLEAAIFAQDEWKISDRLNTNMGLRLYYFQEADYLSLEPRLSASYALNGDVFLKASLAYANQCVHLLTRNDINLPTDLWFPSNDKVKPSQSWQGVLGIETMLFDEEYLLTAEIYYKDMQNLYEYKDDAEFTFGIPVESQFTGGQGVAYGFELFFHKQVGSFTGWLGYTLAWTKRQFDELNESKWFYPRYDRRHDISLTFNYRLGESWELGAAWVYGTGQAFTMPSAAFMFDPVGFDDDSDPHYYWSSEGTLYTDRNAFRLPAYHRLDLNFMYNYKWFGLPFTLSINIYNAYNNRNPFTWYIDYDYEEVEDPDTGILVWKDVKKLKQLTLFPIIPTLGLSFKF